MEIGEKRLKVAELIAKDVKPAQIAIDLGYKNVKSVYQATQSPAVQEQIGWHRDNLFEKSRVDRVKLLRDLYESITCSTSDIFKVLQGSDSNNSLLLASNLSLLSDAQSRLIQQIEMGSTSVPTGELDKEQEPIYEVVGIVSKI